MHGGLIRDHAVRLEELSPALFERYDKDIGELFTRSGAVRDKIFSQRYRFRSQTDAYRAALWHAISDMQEENRDLQLQLAEERRARLELAKIVDGTDNQEKDEKQSQNDKTRLGMEKTVKDKAKSKPESQSSQKVNRKVNWSKSKSTPRPKDKEI
ncbi:hypothetical protein Tco_0985728 [Tanacetum coccineum]